MQTSDYLEQLVQDRDDLVDNLTTKGITGLTGDETFTELVPEVLNIESGGGGWQRPSDWWDTKSILENAENKEDYQGNIVYPAYIILFEDDNKTTVLHRDNTTGNKTYADAYLFSDGDYLNSPGAYITHIWDESKDKTCSDGYKTRYVIVYTKTPQVLMPIDLLNLPCLEIVLGNILCTLNLGGSSSGNLRIMNVVATQNTNIQQYFFRTCRSLSNVSLPNVTSIEENSFTNCSSLINVDLPNVTTIGNYAFSGCINLRNISFPKLISMGNGIFDSCYVLNSFTLSNTIQTLPTSSISFNKYLKFLELPNNFNLDIFLFYDNGLTHSALVDILDKLKDLTGTQETHTITLGTTNTAKLSASELQVATDKGWTVS